MIYVDRFIDEMLPTGWKRKMFQGGGHMLTTDLEELHTMARAIGMRRDWFQKGRFPHYDLSAGKRQAAIGLGAVVIAPGDLPEDMLQLDTTSGTYVPRRVLLARREEKRAG